MSRIKSLMVCGLIATVGSGCQTARSVTSHVASWRPFGSDSAAETAELAESEEAVDEPGADGQLEELKAELASAEEKANAEANDQIALLNAELDKLGSASEIPAVPEEEELDDFAAYAARMAAEESGVDPAAGEEVAVVEEIVAADSAPEMPADSAQTADQADALASQIENLLAEYEPAGQAADAVEAAEMSAEAAAEDFPVIAENGSEKAKAEGTVVKTANLKQKKDASLVAYDLASFADVSVKRDIVRNPELSKTVAEAEAKVTESQMDFADWARDTAEIAEERTVAAVEATAKSDFPWASGAVAAEVAASSKKQAALLIDESDVDSEEISREKLARAKADVDEAKEQALMVSSDMLAMLEEALGSQDWKSADPGEQRAIPLAPELQEIRSLTRSEDAQTRLRGIRLAFEQTKADSPLAGDVSRLLTDDSAIVRAHAASTLYHWNQETDAAVETLSLVVTSKEERPAQLAAMFLGDMTRDSEKVVPVLETALLSTSGATSMHVAEALLKHDPQNVDAVARLTELMRHEDVEVRWLTAHALGSVQGELQPYAVEALRGGLRDIDSQVRATSALSLGGLGKVSRVAVAELTFISAHGEPRVKDAAHIALECIQQ
ncbi:MAG: HEAT repeat domain-containing protein [Rubinisphaera brasiliensis]|uniref:HEAT repeat domain-containing protein n=1 Tax=Rubinisphaera brasiliensis TaxID=119 RepID=UPI00391A6861